MHNALVVAQVALSILLVFGAGLFGRTLKNLQGLKMGFERENIALFSLDIPASYDVTARTTLYQRVLERLEALPGVRSASVSTAGLLSGNNWTTRVSIVAYTPRVGENMTCRGMVVGPRFFETLGTPVVLGRAFGPEDVPSASHVAIINQTMARRFFGGRNPVGRHFTFGGWQNESFEIVGVVADARYRTLREPMMPTFYVPLLQTPTSSASGGFDASNDLFEVRTSSLAELATTIGRAVREVEPRVSVLDVRTMGDAIDQSLAQERLVAQLAGLFGVLALVLASIGLYGVRSYAVARRTNEIGIRMALGASRGDVFRMVLGGSISLVVAGVAIGLPLALLGSRAVRGLLFGLGPSDPMTGIVAIAVMVGVGVLASYLPARRAASVDPMVALRHE